MTTLDRRQFAAGIFASGLTAASAQPTGQAPEHFLLRPNGWMPNNSDLPVLLYRGAVAHPAGNSLAVAMEQMFTAHGWPPQWRNGIYIFHHFHSTAHEILGIAAGEVRVVLGGEGGRDLTLRAGDVVALPAGTGHCSLHSSPDLLVVGAYPAGEHWDICRAAPTPEVLEQMRHVAFPPSDPVYGASGPLVSLWRAGG